MASYRKPQSFTQSKPSTDSVWRKPLDHADGKSDGSIEDDGFTVVGSQRRPQKDVKQQTSGRGGYGGGRGGRGGVSGQYDSRPSRDSRDTRDSRESRDSRDSRGGHGGRGGRGGYAAERNQGPSKYVQRKEAISVKESCKEAVKRACNFKVDELDVKKVNEIVSEICRERNVTDVTTRRTVHSTTIGVIIKYVPHLESGMADCIRRLAEPIRETMQATTFSSSEKEVKGAMGYELLNSICWPGITKVSSTEEYLSAIETLLEVAGCDVLSQNAKGETALSSYALACERGLAPDIEAVRGILRAGIRRENLIKMVQTLINKFSALNVTKLGNIFKLISIIDLNLLVSKLVENTFGLYAFGKKSGRFEWVSANLDVCRAMLMTPIIDDEWASTLNAKFKNPEGVYNALVKRLAALSVAKMQEKKEYLESKGKDECAAIAIDVIGAFVGEASAILGDDQYTEFVSGLLDTPESDTNQNLVLTATAHLLFRLKDMKAPKSSITKFMTPAVIQKLVKACRDKKIHLRITIHLETCVKTFVGETIMADKFDRLLVLFPNKGQESKTFSAASEQDIITQSSFAALRLDDDEPVVEEKKTEAVQEDWADLLEDGETEDVSAFVDLESVDTLIPKFLNRVDPLTLTKTSDVWSEQAVAEWAESVRSQDGSEKLILSMIVAVTGDLLSPKTFSPARLALFKLLLEDVFTQVNVTQALVNFIEAKNKSLKATGSDEFKTLWESPAGFGYFKQLLKLYSLEY